MMLNENQRRSLSATARTIERHILEIEALCLAADYQGIVLDLRNDLPPRLRHETLLTISSLRDRLALLAGDLSLGKQTVKASRMIVGTLNACWEMLEESRASRLSNYGTVDQAAASALDSHISQLIALLGDLEQSFRRTINDEDEAEEFGANQRGPHNRDT